MSSSTNTRKKDSMTPTDTVLRNIPQLPMDATGVGQSFQKHFSHTLGRDHFNASLNYAYQALALTLRDRLVERWSATRHAYRDQQSRRVCYLSLEYLMGRTLNNALINLDLRDATERAMAEYGLEIDDLLDVEEDAGLGNGGLGRLAACFLDSCATMQLPVIGYGIRYTYGMFHQHIDGGHQVECPDHWLRNGYPWELRRPELIQRVRYGGHSERYRDEEGRWRYRWVGSHDVFALPYDVPLPGFQNDTVNTLRLWRSVATDEFDLDEFNAGGYSQAMAAKNAAEQITMVLYPNDASENGKALRMQQQYFLVSASLQDSIRHYVSQNGEDFTKFAEQFCFQLNDTHPSMAVPELMRLLVDEHRLSWDKAWAIVSHTIAYTNHTLLPEALERWSVPLFKQLLPRLLEIIYEINARFLTQVAQTWPGDSDRLRRLSVIEEGDTAMVRMAHLAVIASYSVNGVSALHSTLIKSELFPDFYAMWPERFNNKTNGVTPRRWLYACNPALSALVDENIDGSWITDFSKIEGLRPLADNPQFRRQWDQAKQTNKARLAEYIEETYDYKVDPTHLFDVQVKRIHEYKRQLLNALHVVHRYLRIKSGDVSGLAPRCVIIGGKAAPGYDFAKLIIKFINNVAEVVNSDPAVSPWLKLIFLPDYSVSKMELLCPATDLSEQISTAGKEASGTGNMKFMMNGAITIGTLDGANVEIRDAVGHDNFVLFGLDAEEVTARKRDYRPSEIVAADAELRAVLDLIRNEHFSQFENHIFEPILDALLSPTDPWMTVADFRSYIDAQSYVDEIWQDRDRWIMMSIKNCASSGKFSADRTIADYNNDIWKLKPIDPRAHIDSQ